MRIILTGAVLLAAPMAMAQNVEKTDTYAYVMQQPVPVTEGDITDRPYKVVGHITAGIRKATLFSASASQAKVYRELWERGRKLGADAVVHAQFGESHITALSWGSREARGEAIKFVSTGGPDATPQPAAPSR